MRINNPLLQDFDTAPFSAIKNEDYKPAFETAIEQAKKEIEALVQQIEAPSFNNTIEQLEYTGRKLGRISAIFFNINSAETSSEIQQIAQQVAPWLTKFHNDLMLNEELFQRVKFVYDHRSEYDLNTEQNTLLNQHYKNFVRNGAKLSNKDKEELRKIDTQLAKLSLDFAENILADTNTYELIIENISDLDGLPDGAKETAAALAKSKGKDGYVFTLQFPSYLPFMKYVKNRSLRKELALAYGKKGFQNNSNNNEENVLKIVCLRFKRAKLLGYDNHASFVLEERMAKTPEKVSNFLKDLLEKSQPAAQKEFQELETFANKIDGITRLEKWDGTYYSNLLKKQKFDLDDEALKPFFSLENVLKGAFTVAHKLYGITFKEVQNIDKYHEEVKTFQVYDEKEEFLAIFYTDFHPRPGKNNGAWMTIYKDQMIKNGENERPHASIVCNFSRPTSTAPALLTFNEVTTLFHEFGHALHGMFANTTYPSLSGTSVFWDFVELPSQIMENWCYEEATLNLFAKHYQTGETLPMEWVEKIKKAANFQEGMQTVRQLSFGLLDMAWHGGNPLDINNVKQLEKSAFAATQLYPDVDENCMSTAFGHIFNGGYSAGYYSYKWAEVLDADAFAYFKENGIFNKEIAENFKTNILSKGGTEDPMVLYKRFRGQEPTSEALLKRAGLLT